MVAPSCGAAGEAAAQVTGTSKTDSANMAAMRVLSCGWVDFDIMGTRMLNAFDLRSSYLFRFSLVAFGREFIGGGPLGGGAAAPASPSRSLVAWAATCAILSVISCFWPARSTVTVT